MTKPAMAPGALDIHAHCLVPEVHRHTRWKSLPTLPIRDETLPQAIRDTAMERHERMVATMVDVDDRIARMDAAGVGVQALTVSNVHQTTHWASDEQIERFDRAINDWIGKSVASHPTRLLGLGSVPLHDAALAAAELERALALGLSGVQIDTHVGEREIGDASLHPFWRKAEALGAIIYIHPSGNHSPRFAKHSLWNSVGQSFEETMAIASLIYDGVMDAFPDLKICISHGGGYMPHNFGRMNRNFREKPNSRLNMRRPPIDYLKALWYDSCVYDAEVLQHLVSIVGPDHIVLGSDYPVGDRDAVGFVRSCGFEPGVERNILRDNASALFGLEGGA